MSATPPIKAVPLDIDSLVSNDSDNITPVDNLIDTSDLKLDLNLDQDIESDTSLDLELDPEQDLDYKPALTDSDHSDLTRLNEGTLTLTEHEAILERRVEKIRRKILDNSMYKKFLDSAYRPPSVPLDSTDSSDSSVSSQTVIDSLTQKALARKIPLYFTTPHLTEHLLKKVINWYTIGQRSIKAITKMVNTESEKVRGRHFIIADIYAVLHAAISSGDIPQHKLNNYKLCTRIGELSIAQFQAFYSVWAIGGTLAECIDGTAIAVDKFGCNTRTDIKVFCGTVFRELNSRLRAVTLLQQQALSTGNVISNETVNRDLASSISPGATALFASEDVSALLSRVMAFARRRVIQNRCALIVFIDEVPLDLITALCEKYPNFRALISAELPQRLSRELKDRVEGQLGDIENGSCTQLALCNSGSDAITALDLNKDKLLEQAIASGKLSHQELREIKKELDSCVAQSEKQSDETEKKPYSSRKHDQDQRLSVSEYDRLRQQIESRYLNGIQQKTPREFADIVDGNFPCIRSGETSDDVKKEDTVSKDSDQDQSGYVDLSSVSD